MSVKVVIDHRPHSHFTNLDFLTGKVILTLQSEATIAGIQVKLEAEARTRLAGPRYPHNEHSSDKKRTELEVHKLLYKVTDLFPDPKLVNSQSSPSTAWTFSGGVYEYPFEFKFPFNNSCELQNSMLTNLNISGLKVEMAKQANRHVKRTLPPSLSGFPGMAEIKYYVKATVVRPQFYKENIRAIHGLTFLPIEPPNTGNPKEEAYARRQHQFSNGPTPSPKSLFHKGSKSRLKDAADSLRVSADLRLPNPSILTCNEPIPMRILVSKLSESFETVFLQMIQIELISYTHIQAQDLKRTENGSWVILSRSNMGIPLGRGGDPAGTEWTIDANMWNRLPLPPSVAPSFQTCNISRNYELEVRVGLAHGSVGKLKSQLIVIPLRVPVRVYSGITPPPALLEAIATNNTTKPKQPPHTPSWPQGEDNERPPMPPRPAAPPVNPDEPYDEAPPSYEDAMAETLSPLEGPRREYYPPDVSSSSTRSPVEPGADGKTPVEGPPRATNTASNTNTNTNNPFYSNQAANSSSESFDMLPSTPPESRSGSPLGSPVARQQSVLKIHKVPVPTEESPPQYQLVERPKPVQEQETQGPSRRMNLGVPSRKPVPGSSQSRLNTQANPQSEP